MHDEHGNQIPAPRWERTGKSGDRRRQRRKARKAEAMRVADVTGASPTPPPLDGPRTLVIGRGRFAWTSRHLPKARCMRRTPSGERHRADVVIIVTAAGRARVAKDRWRPIGQALNEIPRQTP